MEKLVTVDTTNVRHVVSRPASELYREVAKGLTAIALVLRQEVTEVDFAAMTAALESFDFALDAKRVAAAFDRCKVELLFLPKPKEVIARLPDREVQNAKPDLKLLRDFYEPYNRRLRLHVFEYEQNYRQVRLEPITQTESAA